MSNIFSYAAVGALILLLIIILPCIVRILQQRISGCFKELKKGEMLGASVRNSAHGKSHEEGALAYTKAWSSLRKPPVPKHLPPKPESTYFTVSCSHLHLWLYGGLFPTGSLVEEVNLQLQSIKIPGHDKSVSAYGLFWRLSSPPV